MAACEGRGSRIRVAETSVLRLRTHRRLENPMTDVVPSRACQCALHIPPPFSLSHIPLLDHLTTDNNPSPPHFISPGTLKHSPADPTVRAASKSHPKARGLGMGTTGQVESTRGSYTMIIMSMCILKSSVTTI